MDTSRQVSRKSRSFLPHFLSALPETVFFKLLRRRTLLVS